VHPWPIPHSHTHTHTYTYVLLHGAYTLGLIDKQRTTDSHVSPTFMKCLRAAAHAADLHSKHRSVAEHHDAASMCSGISGS
jgi:hypothetical protein